MRIEINEAPWKRPIIAAHEECYDHTVAATGRRGVRHILKNRYQFEDLKRLADGMACENCLETFPAKPSSSAIRLFAEVYDKPGQRLPWRERVNAGLCPVCGSEISTEMYQALHEGTLPKIPGIGDRHAEQEEAEIKERERRGR